MYVPSIIKTFSLFDRDKIKKKNKQIFDVQDYKALKAPKTILFWCHNSSRSLTVW